MANGLRLSLWILMVMMAIGVGLYALFFFVFDFLNPDFQARFEATPISARLHIIPGGIALILGGFQFSRPLRTRFPVWHRRLGTMYVASVALGGIGGLLLAFTAFGGSVNGLGFGSLAVLWLYSLAQAYRYALAKDWLNHQRWMIRNYALTLAAVTLRLELPLLQVAGGMTMEQAYATVAWFCWIPNLIVAEWLFVERLKSASS